MRRARLLCAATVGLGLSAWSEAAVIAKWDFGTGAGTFNATATDASVTATPVTKVSSYGSSIGSDGPTGNYMTLGGWPANDYGPTNQTYAEFSVTAQSGQQLNLSGLTFDIGRQDAGPDGWGTRYWLNTSVGGLDTAGAAIVSGKAVTADPPTGNTPKNFQAESVDLSAAGYQGLGSITFRIYYNGGTATGAVLDNITINGTVSAIPEPAGLGLLALGALGLVRRRR